MIISGQIVNTIDNLSKIDYNIPMIKRDLAKKVKNLASKFPVVAVVGPRQSGKTTLAKHVFSGMDYC